MIPAIIEQSDNKVLKFIQKEEIDTTPLFYTESERGVEAIMAPRSGSAVYHR